MKWREVPIHPAAELFPPLPPDELRAPKEERSVSALDRPRSDTDRALDQDLRRRSLESGAVVLLEYRQ